MREFLFWRQESLFLDMCRFRFLEAFWEAAILEFIYFIFYFFF